MDKYGEIYRKSLETLLGQIKNCFEGNLEVYSVSMKALTEDRTAMEGLGDKISEAAQSLEECQKELNEIIWKELKKNE